MTAAALRATRRTVALNVDTTGLRAEDGERLIEIAAVELLGRQLSGRRFHRYLNPEREISPGAYEVHGLSEHFLQDKPVFRQVVGALLDFIHGAECVIHNASFATSFLNSELEAEGFGYLDRHCLGVIDTMTLARAIRPNKRNDLMALLADYQIAPSEHSGCVGHAEQTAHLFLALTEPAGY